jgi:hypothetical protein
MTVDDVLVRARDLADAANSRWISAREELASLNEAYRDSYEIITEKADDYFLKDMVYPWSSATPSAYATNEWFFTLPDDYYKTRTTDFLRSGNWQQMGKFMLNQRNSRSGDPMYRMQNKLLWVVGPGSGAFMGSDVRLRYYPLPYTFTAADLATDSGDSTDIPYPTLLAPEILSYSMAIDYKRKQNIDASMLESRRAELWTRYEQSLMRDDQRYEVWQNVYSTSAPWR